MARESGDREKKHSDKEKTDETEIKRVRKRWKKCKDNSCIRSRKKTERDRKKRKKSRDGGR